MKSQHTIAGAVMIVAGLPLILSSCSVAPSPALAQVSSDSHGTSGRSALVGAPHAEAAVRRLFNVVGGVDLRPDQQAAYQAMAADIEAKYRETDGARSSLREAVAKQAEAGAIDRGALQPS